MGYARVKIGKYKDGGPQSRVTAYMIECKALFSVCLLRFDDGTRAAYHSHAFNAISWVLRGRLMEHCLGSTMRTVYAPSWRPIFTYRETFHQVRSRGTTWVLSFRGPWAPTWSEYTAGGGRVELSAGRVPT